MAEAKRSEHGGEVELASKSVPAERKRIILHLKRNKFGHFVKIAEYGPSFTAKLIMPWSGVPQMVAVLHSMADSVEAAAPPEADGTEAENVRSEQVRVETKQFFFDLRCNRRGYFLKIAQVTGQQRAVITVPSSAVRTMAQAMDELVTESGLPVDVLPESRVIRAEKKRIFFDVRRNEAGMFMSITEVTPSGIRKSINVPQSAWAALRDSLNAYLSETAAGEE